MRCAYEVRLAEGYVADAVALGSFQMRYDERYWYNHHKDSLINRICNQSERKGESVFVFEAKATRADFLNTFGQRYGNHENRFTPVGTHHWVVVTQGIAKPEEIERLKFWGVLEQSAGGLKEIRSPYWCKIEWTDVLKIAHTILWK